MKESVNQVNIEGLINEIRINDIEKNGKKYISGEVIVKVNDKEGLESYIPVSFISADKKANGEPNKIYQNLQALKSFNSIASAGIEKADMIQIRGAKLSENIFMPKGSDKVVLSTRITSNFFTRIQKQNFSPEATFNTIIYIVKMEPEMKNYEGDMQETGRLLITGALVGYKDKIDLVTFIVENEKNIEFINSHYQVGDTVRVGGKLNFSEETVTVSKEVGFGEAEERTYTKRKRELIILRGSAGPLEDEQAYQEEDIKKALLERKARIEETQAKNQQTQDYSSSKYDF